MFAWRGFNQVRRWVNAGGPKRQTGKQNKKGMGVLAMNSSRWGKRRECSAMAQGWVRVDPRCLVQTCVTSRSDPSTLIFLSAAASALGYFGADRPSRVPLCVCVWLATKGSKLKGYRA